MQHCAENRGRIHQLKVCMSNTKECMTCEAVDVTGDTVLSSLSQSSEASAAIQSSCTTGRMNKYRRKHCPVNHCPYDSMRWPTVQDACDGNVLFLSSVTHSIPHSRVPGNSGNENGRSRIPRNGKNVREWKLESCCTNYVCNHQYANETWLYTMYGTQYIVHRYVHSVDYLIECQH